MCAPCFLYWIFFVVTCWEFILSSRKVDHRIFFRKMWKITCFYLILLWLLWQEIYIYVWFGIGRSLIYFFLVTKDELYVFIPKMVDHRNPSEELCGIIYDLFLACIRVSQVPFNWIRDVMTACLNNEWFILAFFTSEAGRSVTLNYYFWFANRPLPSKNIIWFFKKRQHYSGLLFFFFFRGYWEWHLSWVQWPYLELTVNSSWLSFYISWKRQISKSLVRGFELIYSFIFVENPVILVHPATFELVEL